MLGVDVGGVIIARTGNGDEDTFFTEDYLQSPAVPGAFETLAELARTRFAGRVHVVSKCGESVEAKTREWLAHHRFHERTGVPVSHLHFTRTREGKAPIARELGLTHFVDDHLDVLEVLESVPHRLLFLGGGGDDGPDEIPPWARAFETWPELGRHLLDGDGGG